MLRNQLIMTSCSCNRSLSLDTNQTHLLRLWASIYVISDYTVLKILLKNITDIKMIFKNKKNIWARVWSPCIIHVLICIIHVLMHHKMFEILKTAIAITTHRDKNASTCQCPVAKKYVSYLLHIFLTFWRLKTMITYNFHIIK